MGKLDGKVCRGCYKMVCRCGRREGVQKSISQKYPWKDKSRIEFKENAKTWEERHASYEGKDTTSQRKWVRGNNGSKRRKINRLPWK